MSWLMTALPKTGIVGMFDNFGAALANFGNAQGSGFDAFLSGIFNGFGNLFSGLFGSGAINTAFLNYNNRPPADTGPVTPYVLFLFLIFNLTNVHFICFNLAGLQQRKFCPLIAFVLRI